MVSLRRLAELAGVSHVTVYRALHGESYIRPEIRQRILELAALYDYHTQPRTENRKKSGLIGILVGDVSSPVFSRLLKGALQEAFLQDYRVVTLESHHDVKHSCKAIEVFIGQNIEGILLAPGHEHLVPHEYVLRLHSHGIYTVTSEPQAFSVPLECAYSEDRQINELKVRYLMELGHRKIAYVGSITTLRGTPSYDYQMFIETIHQAHMSAPLCFDMYASSPEEIVQQIMHSPSPPTAISVWSDPMAAKLLHELTAAGYRVPRDISIISSGNLTLTESLWPALTTVDSNLDQIGHRCIQMLLAHIANNDSPTNTQIETIAIAPKLVIRKSCATPRKYR